MSKNKVREVRNDRCVWADIKNEIGEHIPDALSYHDEYTREIQGSKEFIS